MLLYGRGFGVGLVGDDYTLLDAALREPLPELLTGRHGILGYYRPVSRELYFWLWGPLSHGQPFLYHLVNALTFAGVLLVLHALLERWIGWRQALLAALAFLVFPPGGALLSWVSCAQDLIALFWGAAALWLHATGRRWPAALALALAVLSKESAVVVAGALVALEWVTGPPPLAARARRLMPAALGLAAAVAIALLARASWPPGTSVAIWSPGQMAGAWRLPALFAASWLPPSTLPGLAEAWRTAPVQLVLAAVLGALAVPGRDPDGPAPQALRGAMRFGLALAVLGLLPVGVILDRWRSYFFGFAALGVAVVLAVVLGRSPWAARALAAALAVVHFGANAVYVPVASATGPARHAHVNDAFFRDNARLTAEMLDPLVPWCDVIRGLPRVVALDVPRQALFETLLGPALRVTCRDTVTRVRWPGALSPQDVRGPYALVRYEPGSGAFSIERPDTRSRRELAETLLLWRRHATAAACLETAADGGGGDSLRAMALVARAASTGVLRPERQAAATHAAIGRGLLATGHAREAALELSLAWGLGRATADLHDLAAALEAAQAFEPAYDAWREAYGLAGDPATRDRVLAALTRLEAIVLGGARP